MLLNAEVSCLQDGTDYEGVHLLKKDKEKVDELRDYNVIYFYEDDVGYIRFILE